MSLAKKTDDFSRKSFEEIEKLRMNSKIDAMEKALKGEKVYYKNERNPSKFIKFLKNRLEIWEQLKDETFHGKRMYEKTQSILQSYKDKGH